MTTKTRKAGNTSQNIDYDTAWKDIIEGLFKDFLDFFFPEISIEIDFHKKPQFLSRELRKMFKDGNIGKRYADVLVKVWLKNGTVRCLFIHIEVQGEPDNTLPERVYVYNYRIYDHYRELNENVVSLVILTDEDKNFRPDKYHVKHGKYELLMKIPIVKIIDFRNKFDELEKSPNPMALVVLAQLKSYEAKRADVNGKYDIKLNLFRECFKRGHGKQQIRNLAKFMDWVINLPSKYQEKLNLEISKIKEENTMPYIPTWERTANEKGKKEGLREGKREGLREGLREGKREGKEVQAINTAKKMLADNLPVETIMKYTGLKEKQIKALMN
jgi:plasmid maintenance system killer protein